MSAQYNSKTNELLYHPSAILASRMERMASIKKKSIVAAKVKLLVWDKQAIICFLTW